MLIRKYSSECKIVSLGNMVFRESENRIVDGKSEYCTIRWKDSNSINVVPISSIRKLPWRIRLYELCTVSNGDQRREGQVIFKGQSYTYMY